LAIGGKTSPSIVRAGYGGSMGNTCIFDEDDAAPNRPDPVAPAALLARDRFGTLTTLRSGSALRMIDWS